MKLCAHNMAFGIIHCSLWWTVKKEDVFLPYWITQVWQIGWMSRLLCNLETEYKTCHIHLPVQWVHHFMGDCENLCKLPDWLKVPVISVWSPVLCICVFQTWTFRFISKNCFVKLQSSKFHRSLTQSVNTWCVVNKQNGTFPISRNTKPNLYGWYCWTDLFLCCAIRCNHLNVNPGVNLLQNIWKDVLLLTFVFLGIVLWELFLVFSCSLTSHLLPSLFHCAI